MTKNTNQATTYYAGNYIYENGNLQFFFQSEGSVSKETTGFKYVYQYKDHLGNIRLSYSDSDNNGTISQSEIIEENNYYPFGLKHKGYNSNVSANGNSVAQKFKYNGIELEESLDLNLYEMDVRSYDPAIGRFTGIDPITHHSMSTYTAFDNNPIFFADPSGGNSRSDYQFSGDDTSIYDFETGKYVINGKEVTLDEALAYVGGPDDWVLGKDEKYTWDANVTSPTDPDLNGREYIGKSIKDVSLHFKKNNPISSFFNDPEMGDTSTWPGEILAHENTIFEDARDFGVENNIPGSETAYEILDDVSVFVTSFDLLNPKGQPLHLDGSVSIRGSSDHIDSGINGLMTVMPIPKFNIRGFNMAQSNKFFKGTWYNKLSANIKGKMLKTFNFVMKKNVTPKKILKQIKSNAEKIKN